MLRILRAFAWMRWRVLLNSLERTGARDTIERLSLAVEQLGPIIAALLLIPSLIGISALSGAAGYALATASAPPLTFEILRYLILAATGLAIVGPIVLPVMEKANPIRLLLLPIPRRTLYVAQAAGALSDPWIVLSLPLVVFLPAGLAIGGALLPAAIALCAGLFLAAVLIGLTMLTSSVAQLVFRDRRRGELVALIFVLVIPVVGMLPGILDSGHRRRSSSRPASERGGRVVPGTVISAGRRVFSLTPSELFVSATRRSVAERPGSGAAAAAALAATAVAIHAVSLLAFRRLLDTPGSSGRRRAARGPMSRALRIPGLPPGASAVAVAQIRLAMRTPRGRSILISPLLVFITLSVMVLRGGEAMQLGALTLRNGVALGTFGAFVCLLAILPLALNQFAIDGAGLTLELLAPISDGELLAGKAVANAALAGGPMLVCVLAAYALFPGGSPWTWSTIPLGIASTYLLAAPASAAASVLFPRAVDLNSIGRGSNAHGAAGLLGLTTFVVAGLPALGLSLLATGWLRHPALAALLLLGWTGVAFVISRLLFIPVRALLARRRENLSLVAG